MLVKRKSKPKHVGTWVLGVTAEGDLLKWGKGGACEYPYTNDKEALDQATVLLLSDAHQDDSFYIAHVFDNGQMKTFSFDHNDMVRVSTYGVEAFVTKK